jgi:hypothetical protein
MEKQIKLSEHTVELVDRLTWGMVEKIRSSMAKALKVNGTNDFSVDASGLSEGKYIALEVTIAKITDKEGKEVAFSRDWMNDLSIEDGDKLMTAVNDFTSPKV